MRRIWVNGKEYAGPEEMPPEVRRDYERALAAAKDVNDDGVPDIVETTPPAGDPEGARPGDEATPPTVTDRVETREIRSVTEITINGKTYSSWDEVPPGEREHLRGLLGDLPEGGEILAGLAAGGGGEEASIEGRPDSPHETDVRSEVVHTSSRTSPAAPREIRVELSGAWGWVVALVLALALIWLLLFRG